ncbi:hypothetical protein GWI33_017897 [Rhynchophorus ferrugineus]|uniref:Uncharacterized protein n=1 Tax=Rhynchophorus ferrugineus TaxID=354439 RepID=A0A834I8B0_RHYFE|nr:hypothetical protein GWI33_017897 [Rhynchophorus ferrugineus]
MRTNLSALLQFKFPSSLCSPSSLGKRKNEDNIGISKLYATKCILSGQRQKILEERENRDKIGTDQILGEKEKRDKVGISKLYPTKCILPEQRQKN